MAQSTSLAKGLLRVGKSWPPDILRPRLQYGNYLVALAQSKQLEKGLTPALVRSQQMLLENSLKDKVRTLKIYSPHTNPLLLVCSVRQDPTSSLVPG